MQRILLSDIDTYAASLLEKAPSFEGRATLVYLEGDLGAGKTTLVQAIARQLGISDNIQSPTYVLMKQYETQDIRFSSLIHIDAYRLDDPKDIAALKPKQFLERPHTLVCVEWPERVDSQLPPPDMHIRLRGTTSATERYSELV